MVAFVLLLILVVPYFVGFDGVLYCECILLFHKEEELSHV